MTASQIKTRLDSHIYQLAYKKPDGNPYLIHLHPQYWTKAKYSCTEDEKDFKFIKGKVYYKGFELVAKLPK